MSEPTTTVYLTRHPHPGPPRVGDEVEILGTATIGRRQERLRETRREYEALAWDPHLVVRIARETSPPRRIGEAKSVWTDRRADARDAYYTALDALDPHPGQGHIYEQTYAHPRARCVLCGELESADDSLVFDDEGDD